MNRYIQINIDLVRNDACQKTEMTSLKYWKKKKKKHST